MAGPRRFRPGFALLGVVLVALILWAIFGRHKDSQPRKAPTVAVAAARASVQDVPVAIAALGSALPWQGVTIHSQVNGKLLQVPVREGSYVKAGALLAEIDPAPYRAVLMQAQGNLKRDEALLADARLDLKRFNTLAAQDSIALQQRDTQAALVQQDEGIVLADRGAVAAAEVNLNWCRIVSPVTGRVGVRLVDPGNIVSTTDTTGIIIVNQISPIAVTFTIPESDFQRLSDVSDHFTRPLATEAFSQENGTDLGSGELSIADNHVDQNTGMVLMKAKFPNVSQHLWPSQFVNVRLTLNTLRQVLTIPAAAVNHGPGGDFAYVIGAGDKVSARPIGVALSQDDIAVIRSGLRAGETVVTDGQLSLKPGSHVRVQAPGGSGRGAGRKGAAA